MKKSLRLKIEETIAGFTLAEVLITLTIIGVIAALTIPALIQNIQDAQYRTAWKKTYSDINQAAQRIITDNGGTMLGLCSINDSNCLRDKYLRYLSYTRSCGASNSFDNCWHNDSNTTKYLNGNSIASWATDPGMVLSNGSLVVVEYHDPDCATSTWGIQECAVMNVDVNGFKGPNTVGKDIFYIHITSNGIKPGGVQGDGNDCNPTGSGVGCSALYLKQ